MLHGGKPIEIIYIYIYIYIYMYIQGLTRAGSTGSFILYVNVCMYINSTLHAPKAAVETEYATEVSKSRWLWVNHKSLLSLVNPGLGLGLP